MEFARFELDDGTAVLVETAESDFVQQYGGDTAPTEGGALERKLAGVAATAQTVAQTLRERLSPDELTVELGLKVSGQAQWFVAKAQTEGTIKVTAKWRRDPAPAADRDGRDAEPAGSNPEPNTDPAPDPQ